MGLRNVQVDGLRDGLAADLNVQRFGAKAGTFAIRTARVAPVTTEKDADVHLVLLRFEVTEELADTVQLLLAFHDELAFRVGQVVERHVEADPTGGFAAEIIEPLLAVRFGPGVDGSTVEGEPGVGDDEVLGIVDGIAEALAAGAGSGGAVEAEEDGFGFAKFEDVVLADEFFAKEEAFGSFGVGSLVCFLEDDFAGFAVAGFCAVYDALAGIG